MTYLTLELPQGALFRAVAEEASATDSDLDEIEAHLRDESGLDPGQRAAFCLTLGRAGRASSAQVIERVEAELRRAGAVAEADSCRLARALLAPEIPPDIERAESGYRVSGLGLSGSLYVEDPIAAHWHRRGRIGPPIRPDRDRAPIWLRSGQLTEAEAAIDEGAIGVVTFWPTRRRPEPALRICRAGFARDCSLRTLIRWSSVTSVGVMEDGARPRVAWEARGLGLSTFPSTIGLESGELINLLARLLKRSRS